MNRYSQERLDIFSIVWRKRIFIFWFVFIVTVISIIVSLMLPKWYRATSVILSPSSGMGVSLGSMGIIGNLGLGDMFGGNEDQNRYLSILKSRSLIESVINKYHLKGKYKCENMDDTILKFKKYYNISVGEELQITISFYDKNQDEVANIVNYKVFCLDSINNMIAQSKAKNIKIFIGERVNEIIDSLSVLESEISSFMEEEGILSLEDQVRVGVVSAAEIKLELIKKEIELIVAKKSFEGNNPIIKNIQNEIDGIKEKYKTYFGEDSKDNLFLNFSKVPNLGIKYNRFDRKVEYYKTLIEFLGPQYEKAKIDEQKDIPTVQVIDKAVRPDRKAKPKKAKIVVICFLMSFIAASYYLYFSERFKHL